jgi:hypothetical protein
VAVFSYNLTNLGEFKLTYPSSHNYKAVLAENGHFYQLLVSQPKISKHQKISAREKSIITMKGTQDHSWQEEIFIED